MEQHDTPPRPRPQRLGNIRNVNAAPKFEEPKIHPAVDDYLRGKIAKILQQGKLDRGKSAERLTEEDFQKQIEDEIASYFIDLLNGKAKGGVQTVEQFVQSNKAFLDQLRQEGRYKVADAIEQRWNFANWNFAHPPTMPPPDILTSEKLMQLLETERLQKVWLNAARGNFTGVNAEIVQDITRINEAISIQRQDTPLDAERYDTAVAELAKWQVDLKANPVNPNTMSGQQTTRAIWDLIQQRDSTETGKLNKQLKNLERVQKTVNTLSRSK